MKALLIIKPENLKKAGDIISTIKKDGIEILACKTMLVNNELAESLYAEHKGKYFYETLIGYLTLGTCMLVAIEGDEALIKNTKKLLREEYKAINWEPVLEHLIDKLIIGSSAVDKLKQDANFVSEFKTEFSVTFDAIHCSDPDAGDRELKLFFHDHELIQKKVNIDQMVELILEKMLAKNAKTNLYQSSPLFINGGS